MATKTVNSVEGLNAALKSAQGGDTILLAPGTYSGLQVNALKFDTPVTIASADPKNEAVLKEFGVFNSKGLSFANLEFSSVNATEYYAYRVVGSENVKFDNINIHGSMDGNPANDRSGFLIDKSSQVTIANSDFQQLGYGIVHQDSKGLTFSGNSFSELRTDGIHGGGSSQVTITKNFFTDFMPAEGDHPDAIQFFTRGTAKAATDLVISDNIVMRGDGKAIEGVFFMDENGNMPFKNVTITHNLVVGGMYDGITVLNVDGFTVTGNKVLAYADQGSRLSIFQSSNGTSKDNVATTFLYDKTTNVALGTNTTTGTVADQGVSALKAWLSGVTDHPALDAIGGAPTVPTTPTQPTTPTIPTVPTTPTLPSAPDSVKVPPTDSIKTLPISDSISTAPTGNDDPVFHAPSAVTSGLFAAKTTLLTGSTLNLTLTGSNAIDAIGSAGNNIITGNDARNQLAGMNGDDDLRGEGGNDYIRGDAGNDIAYGGTGNDEILGGTGNDTLWGGDGADTISGNEDRDLIYGDMGNDQLNGNAGNDTIYGGAGDDVIRAGQEDDQLFGGSGNDRLFGDKGSDTLTGGSGADHFYIGKGYGVDKVTDFSFSEGDRVHLDGVANYTVSQVGANTVVDLGGGDQLVLLGVNFSTLPASGWIVSS